jgi:hypothetical protein
VVQQAAAAPLAAELAAAAQAAAEQAAADLAAATQQAAQQAALQAVAPQAADQVAAERAAADLDDAAEFSVTQVAAIQEAAVQAAVRAFHGAKNDMSSLLQMLRRNEMSTWTQAALFVLSFSLAQCTACAEEEICIQTTSCNHFFCKDCVVSQMVVYSKKTTSAQKSTHWQVSCSDEACGCSYTNDQLELFVLLCKNEGTFDVFSKMSEEIACKKAQR